MLWDKSRVNPIHVDFILVDSIFFRFELLLEVISSTWSVIFAKRYITSRILEVPCKVSRVHFYRDFGSVV